EQEALAAPFLHPGQDRPQLVNAGPAVRPALGCAGQRLRSHRSLMAPGRCDLLDGIPCGIFQRSIHKMPNDSRARKPNRTACFTAPVNPVSGDDQNDVGRPRNQHGGDPVHHALLKVLARANHFLRLSEITTTTRIAMMTGVPRSPRSIARAGLRRTPWSPAMPLVAMTR